MTDTRLLEICVDDAAGLAAAIEGGADRIELCAALGLGGLTPAPGLMALAGRAGVPVYAMIRPRAGDFVFADDDIVAMEGDIDQARASGLAGVVLGASLADGQLDARVLERLVTRAEGLGLTLHRAFDLVPDFGVAIEIAAQLGFERILSSGGARTALAGIETLAGIVGLAGERIAIMPGAGVSAENVGMLVGRLGVGEVHASGSAALPPVGGKVLELGFDLAGRKGTDAETLRALRLALDATI